MRSGRLDRTINIERSTHSVDAAGTPAFAWSPVVELRAELIEANTEEFIRSFGAGEEQLRIFRSRFVEGVTTADQIVFEGKRHNIREVKELGRRRGLEIRTTEVKA